MFAKVRRKNEEILEEHFQTVFGEDHQVKVAWGFPVTSISIRTIREGEDVCMDLGFNCETLEYSLATKAFRLENGKEISIKSSVDSGLIDFIIERTNEFNEQFLATTQLVKNESVESAEPVESNEEVEPNKEASAETETEVEAK